MTWILDLSPFGDSYAQGFKASLAELGIEFKDVDPCDIESSLRKLATKYPHPFLYGSIALMKARQKVSVPTTAWLDWNTLRYSTYAPTIREWLLNSEFKCVPWSKLRSVFAAQPSVFIRPDSHDKIFGGAKVEAMNCPVWMAKQENLYSVPGDTQCIVAPATQIECEWRFFVSKTGVLDCSGYARHGKPELFREESDALHQARALVERVVQRSPLPFPVYVVDAAWTGSEARVLELGSVNCCDWYACDPNRIIAAIQPHLQ